MTPVCHAVDRGVGRSASREWGLHLWGLHAGEVCIQGVGQTYPLSDTTVYGQRAGSTHPTGMHTYFLRLFILLMS